MPRLSVAERGRAVGMLQVSQTGTFTFFFFFLVLLFNVYTDSYLVVL